MAVLQLGEQLRGTGSSIKDVRKKYCKNPPPVHFCPHWAIFPSPSMQMSFMDDPIRNVSSLLHSRRHDDDDDDD